MRKLALTGFLTLILILAVASITSIAWEGTGGGHITVVSVSPRIVEVTFDKRVITPGEWVTITVKVTNDGPDTAPIQTIHIGLPFDPPTSDIQIVSTDLSEGAKIYPKGSTLYTLYGSGATITSKYPIVEGEQKNFTRGAIRTLTIRVKFPNTTTVAFDVKTVAATADWKVIGKDPSSGMVDQQGEYVRTYLILSAFTVTMGQTDVKDIAIPITHHNRYPPSGVSQPSMVLNRFEIIDSGGFKGSITPLNIPLTISPGSTANLMIRVSTSGHPSGTYTITYKVSGTP